MGCSQSDQQVKPIAAIPDENSEAGSPLRQNQQINSENDPAQQWDSNRQMSSQRISSRASPSPQRSPIRIQGAPQSPQHQRQEDWLEQELQLLEDRELYEAMADSLIAPQRQGDSQLKQEEDEKKILLEVMQLSKLEAAKDQGVINLDFLKRNKQKTGADETVQKNADIPIEIQPLNPHKKLQFGGGPTSVFDEEETRALIDMSPSPATNKSSKLESSNTQTFNSPNPALLKLKVMQAANETPGAKKVADEWDLATPGETPSKPRTPPELADMMRVDDSKQELTDMKKLEGVEEDDLDLDF